MFDKRTMTLGAIVLKVNIARIDRFAFYERAKSAFAILATGETRIYGCILIRKGMIRPK